MCGICGYFSGDRRVTRAKLEAMRAALSHRGPDDAGIWLDGSADGSSAGLAQCRLSILDLSPAGHQPMSGPSGETWIAYNGEFYNFQEPRAEFAARGRAFRSTSDTEVILHLYEEHGFPETLSRMNGMFAVALWDARRKKLLLARDRLGKKPLYYAHVRPGEFAIASEIKALLAGGMADASRLDATALDQIWSLGYPLDDRTAYADIRQLPPGCWAEWDGEKLAVHRYWQPPFDAEPVSHRRLDDWADELEALLADAIRLRLIADVPVGLFLSGGIDSSLVAALTARKLGVSPRAYTIAFREAGFDESPHAAAVAKHLGLPHDVLTVSGDLSGSFARIAAQFDEPFGDSSAIPTWHVAKRARQHVTVVLSGDGGDELFAGYPWYREGLRLWGTRDIRRRFARPLTPMERLRDFKLRAQGLPAAYHHLRKVLADGARTRLFTPDFLREAGRDRGWTRGEPRASGALRSMQAFDLASYLPSDILVKVDRMTMAHALESRSPLLDYRVAEFAARLPFEIQFDERGRGKRLLRHLLARHVPRELFERPKQGFSVPFDQWCRGAMAAPLATRWRAWGHPWFRRDAADWLFPADGPSHPHLAWTAFATLNTLARE